MKPGTIELSTGNAQKQRFSAIPLTGSCFDGYALAPHLEKTVARSGASMMRRSAPAEALYRYRYQGDGSLLREIAGCFAAAITALSDTGMPAFDGLIMVPPPLSRTDYAPVVALVTEISRITGIPSLQFAAQDRSGPSDVSDKRAERPFAFSSPAIAVIFNSKQVLVIDDIYRSGRSLNRFCSLIKQEGGALRVTVLVGTVVERGR